jgi:hypothetical protein
VSISCCVPLFEPRFQRLRRPHMIVFVSSEHFSWGDNQRSRGANLAFPNRNVPTRAEGGVAWKLETWGDLSVRFQ